MEYSTSQAAKRLGKRTCAQIHAAARIRGIKPRYAAGRAFWTQAQLDAIAAPRRIDARKGWASYPQAAESLGIARSTLRARIVSRGVPKRLHGGRMWVRASDLKRLA